MTRSLFLSTMICLAAVMASAKVTRMEFLFSGPYRDGKLFGRTGSYERIVGRVHGEVDPMLAANSIITDILLAPRNANGRVEYVSDYILLMPNDRSKWNGLLFLSLPNRGNAFDPDTTLLSRGYAILWCAWQGDVLPGGGRLVMKVPVVPNITGLMRTELQVGAPAKTLLLSSGYFNGMNHQPYQTVSLDNTGLALTRRVHEADPREKVPNSDWAFSDCRKVEFPGQPDAGKISVKGGFDPGYIYELVYTAKDPLVLGLGFAAIRDVGSYLKYKHDAPLKAAIMQGVSQCGNFIRSFLNLGFNQDEEGRVVFDGLNAHIATRRVTLNVRFGRPGGGGLQREDHEFAGNEAPFTWDSSYDAIGNIHGGILDGCRGARPKIFQTLSSSEYWQLRASQRTADVFGTKDEVIPSNVRIYLFSGTQHVAGSQTDRLSGMPMNSNNYNPYLRALLLALEEWVLYDKLPPANTIPTIAAGTLVKPDKKSTGWPSIPGIPYNGKANDATVLDFGPQYDARRVSGILSEPPRVISDKKYTMLVPKVDEDGNEIAGIRSVAIRVPLGTYTGWSIRQKGYGEGDLAVLSGMFIPFKKTKAERVAAGDPRLSLEERYGTHDKYVAAVKKAVAELVQEGFLLPTDAEVEIKKAEQSQIL